MIRAATITGARVPLFRQNLFAGIANTYGIRPAACRHRHLVGRARIAETLATAAAVMLVQAGPLEVGLARMAMLENVPDIFQWKESDAAGDGVQHTIISVFGFQ